MAVALWSCGPVALWPHWALVLASARPRASLGLARLLWSAGRAHTALVVRRWHAHGSSGLQVAGAQLHWTAGCACIAHMVCRSRAHGACCPQVAHAQLPRLAGRTRTDLVVPRSYAHGSSDPQVARARLQRSAGRARTALRVARAPFLSGPLTPPLDEFRPETLWVCRLSLGLSTIKVWVMSPMLMEIGGNVPKWSPTPIPPPPPGRA